MMIMVVDTETDNVKPYLANILEIGMASVDLSSGKIELLFDTLVCPEGPEYWCSCWFMNNSGVDPDLVRHAPKFADIKDGIEAYLSIAPVTAFNLSFDLQVLNKHYVRAPMTWPCLMLTTKTSSSCPGIMETGSTLNSRRHGLTFSQRSPSKKNTAPAMTRCTKQN